VHLNISVHEFKKYVRDVLEAVGYSEVRRGYLMRIALDQPMDKPPLPTGFEFRPFDPQRDGAAVHAVFQETFADHWGNVAQTPYEQWAHTFEDPKFDPTLWYILYHHDTIAAICLCEVSGCEKSLGLVDVLGVRNVYRKQGFGSTLLRHGFHAFQERGFEHVSLEVDTQNKTNAVAVYERAGMSVYRCIVVYRKVLRDNPEVVEN
jgi:mycothiol synthase